MPATSPVTFEEAATLPVKAYSGGPTKDPMPLLDRPWFMLGLLFLAALVLGLPFLWKSRAFQTPTKIVIAILVTLETIVVFWAFTVTMMWCYRTIMDSLR